MFSLMTHTIILAMEALGAAGQVRVLAKELFIIFNLL
jgi:hypothetical protein